MSRQQFLFVDTVRTLRVTLIANCAAADVALYVSAIGHALITTDAHNCFLFTQGQASSASHPLAGQLMQALLKALHRLAPGQLRSVPPL